ncbi:hypothetical protein [Mycolicibacterium smegmatis]|uniref:Uncharacterized protein n=1 Tax=Mycolicibacterium smegmatis (strain MKD8) TaxID=1214915 RepID=A0A2U9PR47_MYCSE|nr:hypothetical protein [Mycolicibacterium smegmatis]AWT54246.1 hypothetical protein D806_032740 [Mycolicibacterium smegmatis MKD8]
MTTLPNAPRVQMLEAAMASANSSVVSMTGTISYSSMNAFVSS